MGVVVQMNFLVRRIQPPDERLVAVELLGIANRLDALKNKTEFPRWLSALSGEIRRAARECRS